MRPPKTTSTLRAVLDAGYTLKEIAGRSGLSYDTLRAISRGRLSLSHRSAQKIAQKFPVVTVDYLLGTGVLPGAHSPSEYENQSTAIVKTTTPMTPALFNEAAVKALKQSAQLMGYTLPTDPLMLNRIAHHTWLGQRAIPKDPEKYAEYKKSRGRKGAAAYLKFAAGAKSALDLWRLAGFKLIKGEVVIPVESKHLLSDEDRAAIQVIFDMHKAWAFLSDKKAPKHTGNTTTIPEWIGQRMGLFQYWSYLRAQYLPKEEMQARPDLMTAFEALLLNAQAQLFRMVEGPRGPEPRNDSYLVANEVMAFIRATRKKYNIRPDFSYIHKRSEGRDGTASPVLTRDMMTTPEPRSLAELYRGRIIADLTERNGAKPSEKQIVAEMASRQRQYVAEAGTGVPTDLFVV